MNTISKLSLYLSLPALALASCANAEDGETGMTKLEDELMVAKEYGTFERPWAIEFIPGSPTLAITEKAGTLKLLRTKAKGEYAIVTVSGVPEVAYGGQGGLGDIAFLESEAGSSDDTRTIFLSWAEADASGDHYGAAVGKGKLVCTNDPKVTPENEIKCAIEALEVIWRQAPKVMGRGHYSHRLELSPDEKYLFIASGDRQKQKPAQNLENNMGTIVRLNLDGTPAEGNPFADQGGITKEIWSYGHRNILGMDFAPDGRLWEVEHGPAGGDELNLVKEANNYGWPVRSNGDNYNGIDIPDHTEDDGFTKPAIHWTPVIAPGDMVFYSGKMNSSWKGDAFIPGLGSKALVRVEIDGDTATEAARYDLGGRLRSVAEGPDGSILVVQDGEDAKLFRIALMPPIVPPAPRSMDTE